MKTVIEMAREAGWKDLRDYDSEMRHDFFMGNTDSLERLVELARADERNIVMNEPLTKEMWQRFEDDIRADERKATLDEIAKWLEGEKDAPYWAELVRARSNT